MTADDVKRLLQLTPLEVEGGFFRETYRSRWQVSAEFLPGRSGQRAIGTAIYYLITPESFSSLHKLPGTEIFHFYLGDAVEMLQLHGESQPTVVTLGQNIAAGELVQVIVRGGVWQGMRLAKGGQWALLGTTMSPGFDYADYETGDREKLIARYPAAAEWITRYTR
jgi:predicted cupin superfamily sugar epimerase